MNKKHLTILHSNDLHGDFLAEKIDEKLVGGVSLLSGYINKVRAEEDNVIYAIAGDMFRGSVIDSEYKGISTIEIMNAIAPDVVSIGNHEADYGFSHLLFIEKCAKFPIINANLHIKTNGARLFQPYKIIEIGGMKILFIGIITEEVLASAKKEGLIGTIINTAAAAEEIGKICNAHNGIDIDFTVVLTHIGWQEDHNLAALLDPSWGVDVIIGGHSHTFIEQPDFVNGIAIVQAGTGTDGIGRFDLEIDTDNNCLVDYKWQYIPINNDTCPVDHQIEELICNYKNDTDKKYGRVVCKFLDVLTHPSRLQETELGNLVADIFQQSLGVDVALVGSGSIRVEQAGPIITFGKLSEIYPYGGKQYLIKVTADTLRKMLLYINREDNFINHGEYYQLSKGINFIYSKSKRDFIKCTLNGEELIGDRIISVALSEFHFSNIKDFLGIDPQEYEKNGAARVIATYDFDLLVEYLSNCNIVDSNVEGRMVLVD